MAPSITIYYMAAFLIYKQFNEIASNFWVFLQKLKWGRFSIFDLLIKMACFVKK